MPKHKKESVVEKTNLEKNVDKESRYVKSKKVKNEIGSISVVQDASSDKSSSKRLFEQIPAEKYFVLCDGRAIKDYVELAFVMENMSDDVFAYHVNSDKNDFANWINDVFHEETLASNIRGTKSRIEILYFIYKNLFEKLGQRV